MYAQLYTPDGQHHGLNGFLVPIRDTKTLEPFAGVTVGDLGEKIGLNGIDNGFVSFNNYRIPKEFLLARTGDISDDGQYVSPIKNNKKRIGASFGALSGGRVNICGNLCSIFSWKEKITSPVFFSQNFRNFQCLFDQSNFHRCSIFGQSNTIQR